MAVGSMVTYGEKWDETSTTQGKASSAKKPPSGTLYTAVAHTTVPAKEGLTDCFYIDLGASDHLVPSKGDLRADRVFEQHVEIAVANSGKIYAYSTGYLRVATPASGVERR